MIQILRAPAFATVQDGGRQGFRRYGVPPGGAMDRVSLGAANEALGNAAGAAAIEWALTGGAVRFTTAAHFTITGATVDARLDGAGIDQRRVHETAPGATLEIERFVAGRFCYVCVSGGLDVPVVLGGRGTYLPAGFGGVDGRLLRDGDVIPIGDAPDAAPGASVMPRSDVLDSACPIELLPAPQADLLGDEQWRTLFSRELAVSPQSDRTGYRLTGAGFEVRYDAGAHSEPSCVGAVQLTPDGTLIVLMPDGPTISGYPRIAVVTSDGIARLAQRAPGTPVCFKRAE